MVGELNEYVISGASELMMIKHLKQAFGLTGKPGDEMKSEFKLAAIERLEMGASRRLTCFPIGHFKSHSPDWSESRTVCSKSS